jgi:DNA-binding winged helix-turn-helix (wHTH) protein
VWCQCHLSDSCITRCVSAARKAFGNRDCIKAVYRRGYMWTIALGSPSPDDRLGLEAT